MEANLKKYALDGDYSLLSEAEINGICAVDLDVGL